VQSILVVIRHKTYSKNFSLICAFKVSQLSLSAVRIPDGKCFLKQAKDLFSILAKKQL